MQEMRCPVAPVRRLGRVVPKFSRRLDGEVGGHVGVVDGKEVIK